MCVGLFDCYITVHLKMTRYISVPVGVRTGRLHDQWACHGSILYMHALGEIYKENPQ